jgi:hypothetical protein
MRLMRRITIMASSAPLREWASLVFLQQQKRSRDRYLLFSSGLFAASEEVMSEVILFISLNVYAGSISLLRSKHLVKKYLVKNQGVTTVEFD